MGGIGKHYRHATTINVLPDDVLLEIFDFRRQDHALSRPSDEVWQWHILVHVCRRWRHIMFASPLRLNLKILCTYGTPVRKSIDIWPAFPIVIRYDTYGSPGTFAPTDEDSVTAALEHTSRVCKVILPSVTGAQLGRIAEVMQEPFPALTHLVLWLEDRNIPVLPGQFLGRSAPCLQELILEGIPFPALPILLPSASDLTTLSLISIPQTGYISPEEMVAGLATLTRLRYLIIGFRSPNSRPDQIRLPPTTRTVLPALTSFIFHGVREYLEDFAAGIDAPQLHEISIDYFNQLVDFDVPQISMIIDHMEALKQVIHCRIELDSKFISFDLSETDVYIDICIKCEGIDWQVSHLTHALSQTSLVPSNIIHLTIESYFDPNKLNPEDVNDVEWLQLLNLSTSVQSLIVPEQLARHISRALEVIAEGVMATAVLPALDMLCLEGRSASSVDKFIAARRDSGRPVTIIDTKREIIERIYSSTYMR